MQNTNMHFVLNPQAHFLLFWYKFIIFRNYFDIADDVRKYSGKFFAISKTKTSMAHDVAEKTQPRSTRWHAEQGYNRNLEHALPQ